MLFNVPGQGDVPRASAFVADRNLNGRCKSALTSDFTLRFPRIVEAVRSAGGKVNIEVVTFGPGLHMLRDDTSPVKTRIASMALSTPSISFKACGNTQENMRKAEDKDIRLVAEAKVVKSGVVHVMELQEQGWTYVRP